VTTNKENKYVIMCVGYTHSGKTTFAKKLIKNITNIVLIDNDEIASFINETYKTAVFSEYNKEKRTFGFQQAGQFHGQAGQRPFGRDETKAGAVMHAYSYPKDTFS